MSTNESVETFNPKTCLNRLNKIIRQDHIKVGISNGFENLYELSKYYEEAIKALKEGEAKDENIFIYTD